jgi:hypothetical protein
MALQQGIGYVHATERPHLWVQVVKAGELEGEKWGYLRIAEMAVVR